MQFGIYKYENTTHWFHIHPFLSILGLAVSTSRELLCLKANREKCVYCVHAGCFWRLSGPQRARAATSGMEALL